MAAVMMCLSLFTVSCSRLQYRMAEGIAWNTLYHITYESDRELADSIISVLDEIDYSLSPFNPNSGVSRINDNRSTEVDSHFVAVYNESRKINVASGGVFDPTLAPLIRTWGFGQGHEITSDTLRIDSLLNHVGINKTQLLDGQILKDDPAIEFNFSALAKGYGVDCIADMLERNGVDNYLVEVGGEIRAKGVNPKGDKWCIGVDRPSSESSPGETVMNLFIENGAVATSGNYRNYQQAEGGRIGHTISPKTGRPVATDVISATVVMPQCMEADALATACMILSPEEAIDLCTAQRAGCMLILKDMSVVSNPAFRSLLQP